MNEAPTPVTVYSGQTTNWTALALTIVATAALLVNALVASTFDAITVVTVILIVAALVATIVTSTSLRVSVGSNGVMIRAGLFGWPRYTCPLDRIESVEQIEISALSWGAGYWRLPGGRLRFTLRNGPAIRIRKVGGGTITVNVDDPAAAVAAIEGAR